MDTLKNLYANKESAYYSSVKSAILPLLPQFADRVLEIGCGSGNSLVWLKETGRAGWIGGVEMNEEAAKIASTNLDWFCQGNIETISLPFHNDSINVILCLDVLEHLIDPWTMVVKLSSLIKPGGCLIASIPNIRHHSALFPLVFKGDLVYKDRDILDRTHLRFFTKRTAVELLEAGDLKVDEVLSPSPEFGSKSWFALLLSFGLAKPFLEFQYTIRARK